VRAWAFCALPRRTLGPTVLRRRCAAAPGAACTCGFCTLPYLPPQPPVAPPHPADPWRRWRAGRAAALRSPSGRCPTPRDQSPLGRCPRRRRARVRARGARGVSQVPSLLLAATRRCGLQSPLGRRAARGRRRPAALEGARRSAAALRSPSGRCPTPRDQSPSGRCPRHRRACARAQEAPGVLEVSSLLSAATRRRGLQSPLGRRASRRAVRPAGGDGARASRGLATSARASSACATQRSCPWRLHARLRPTSS